MPTCSPGGGFAPNHSDRNAAALPAAVCPEPVSMKMTDSPGAIVVTPFSASDEPKENELSSTRQPEMFAAAVPTLVTSNQSSPTGLLPLDHGATSEMMSDAAPPV